MDAVRYYCVSRVESAGRDERHERDGGEGMDYGEFMTGRGADASYLGYA